MTTENDKTIANNFIKDIIQADLDSSKHVKIQTRFPPEPNGYLHIGHAKSICVNFGLAAEFKGACNLRFDDTNPEKESQEYVEAIKADVEWLGFEWQENPYASDYFPKLYQYALDLINKGLAYVDSQSADKLREKRGTLKEVGSDSPFRNRTIEENLALFTAMKNGEHQDGSHVLRAKIDMGARNINMRDPIIYRIRHIEHHQTGSEWCIYPMYDFTHALSDALESITHSLCTLEFEDHRPLYDWMIANLDTPSTPRQIEFSRLNLEYNLTSKRKLNQLVVDKHVTGWNDPRMPTISGMRRRGFTAESIRTFAEVIGVTKKDSLIEMGVLENCVRDDLNTRAERRMAVLDPLKVIVENYPDEQTEMFEGKNHPQNPDFGTRKVPFSKELYIEKSDFMLDAPKKFFRLSIGREVRFRFAYYLTCTDVVYADDGEIDHLICTYDPESKGGRTEDGRKVKGTIHWVSAPHAMTAQVNIYDRLFHVKNPAKEDDIKTALNPESLTQFKNVKCEPAIQAKTQELAYQFERMGYFIADETSTAGKPVFNRTMSLRDSWGKIEKQK